MKLYRFVTTDPGLLRFQFALRVVAATILGGALTAAVLVGVLHQPATTVVPGVMLANLTIMASAADSLAAKRRSVALLLLPAFAGATLAAIFMPYPLVSDFVFLGVIFIAVLFRWFGRPGMAFGMAAYMTYFITIFVKIQPHQLGYVALGQVIAVLSGYIVIFWLLRDKPESSLPTAVRALRLQTADVLVQCHAMLPHTHSSVRQRKQIERQLVILHTAALTIESQLEQIEPDRFDYKDYNKDLSAVVFNLELATEQVVTEWRRGSDIAPDEVAIVQDFIYRMAQDLHGNRPLERQELDEAYADLSKSGRSIVANLIAMRRLSRQLRSLNVRAQVKNLRAATLQETSETPDSKKPDHPEVAALFKTAFQTLVATGLAVALGSLLSDDRSYWAVIAAFVTFMGTKSRGEMAYKGWQRVIGTVGGVVMGSLVGLFLAGNTYIDVGLIVVMLFLAMYYVQVAYSVMIFWITTMIALLYGLLGYFSIELLGLRLAETLIGVAAGLVVAFFVMPVRTEATIRSLMAKALSDLHDVVKQVTEAESLPDELAQEARDLDKTMQDIRKATRPLAGTPWAARNGDVTRQWVRDIAAISYYSRLLSRRRVNWDITPPAIHASIRRVSRDLQHTITRLGTIIEDPSARRSHFRRVDLRIAEMDAALDPYRALPKKQQPKNMRHLESYLRITRRLSQVLEHLRASV